MWLGGVVVLLAAAVAAVTRLGREFRTAPTVVPWDIPAVASTYTGIVGALAGFTVASTVFLANLSGARGTEAFVATMGMFLIAFVGFLVASQMFGTLPNRATPGTAGEDDALAQRLGFLLAIVGYYIALSIGWLGLRPLLLGLGLRSLADVFAWLLLAAVFAGAARLGVFLYRLTRVGGAACLAVPLVGFGAAAAYRLVAVRFVPSLWPARDAPLRLALVVPLAQRRDLRTPLAQHMVEPVHPRRDDVGRQQPDRSQLRRYPQPELFVRERTDRLGQQALVAIPPLVEWRQRPALVHRHPAFLTSLFPPRQRRTPPARSPASRGRPPRRARWRGTTSAAPG